MTNAFLVIGLGYGDEGKGSWVDHLVRTHGVRYVVRFNGGAQALHHVVTSEGIVHGFAQFGSGTFVPGTMTCLSRFMLIEPQALLTEAGVLEEKGIVDPTRRLIVSENAPVITPFHRLLNRIQEVARGQKRHGSCGFGIGVTQADVETLGDKAVRVRDLLDGDLKEKLQWHQERKCREAEMFAAPDNEGLRRTLSNVDIPFYEKLFQEFAQSVNVESDIEFGSLIRSNDTVFEGAQGVLLDQSHGFFPYCTRSNTAFQNAEKLLEEAGFRGSRRRIGLLRGYATRHGPGPFVTEDHNLAVSKCHNSHGEWQGPFRLGWFDAVAGRYGLEAAGGVDQLVITNVDRLRHLETLRICESYQHADEDFFTRDRILPFNGNLEASRRRTQTMQRIRPLYRDWRPEHHSTEFDTLYLDQLSESLGRQVDASSSTMTHEKIDRVSASCTSVEK